MCQHSFQILLRVGWLLHVGWRAVARHSHGVELHGVGMLPCLTLIAIAVQAVAHMLWLGIGGLLEPINCENAAPLFSFGGLALVDVGGLAWPGLRWASPRRCRRPGLAWPAVG